MRIILDWLIQSFFFILLHISRIVYTTHPQHTHLAPPGPPHPHPYHLPTIPPPHYHHTTTTQPLTSTNSVTLNRVRPPEATLSPTSLHPQYRYSSISSSKDIDTTTCLLLSYLLPPFIPTLYLYFPHRTYSNTNHCRLHMIYIDRYRDRVPVIDILNPRLGNLRLGLCSMLRLGSYDFCLAYLCETYW